MKRHRRFDEKYRDKVRPITHLQAEMESLSLIIEDPTSDIGKRTAAAAMRIALDWASHPEEVEFEKPSEYLLRDPEAPDPDPYTTVAWKPKPIPD